ncbi:MAG: sodium:calcium antiporter [Chloroflexi bacterium]|nr:MAG: sodium:calcium antiporter [Chloroflexota bacterium]
MPWIRFLLSAAVVVFAAIKLAEYGDIIAVRTRLGGVFVGTIFLAGATSLPELLTSISAFRAGVPDLAAGNFFGSNMVNMLLLALVDLINYQVPLLRRIAISHALTAALTTVLMLIAIISIMADVNLMLGWMGVDSLLLIFLYFWGVWLIQRENNSGVQVEGVSMEPAEGFPTLRKGVLGFAGTAVLLILVVPQLVQASNEIAAITGLGSGFVGTALLSLVTSLPELLAALAAMRINAFDMAVGNLFGSSVFNMLALGIADVFYLNGRFLGDIDPDFALVGLLGLLLINMALVGNLARVERKVLFVELDTLAILITYLLGMYLLFLRGIGA